MIHTKISFYLIRKPRWKTSCPHKSEPREKTYFPRREEDQRNYLLMEPEQYFENEVDGNHHNNMKSRNYFPSRFDTNQIPPQSDQNWIQRLGKLDGKFFVELAIFIDQDLFKLMAENFPIDTEEHIIQVVLAMINAVSAISKYFHNFSKCFCQNFSKYFCQNFIEMVLVMINAVGNDKVNIIVTQFWGEKFGKLNKSNFKLEFLFWKFKSQLWGFKKTSISFSQLYFLSFRCNCCIMMKILVQMCNF